VRAVADDLLISREKFSEAISDAVCSVLADERVVGPLALLAERVTKEVFERADQLARQPQLTAETAPLLTVITPTYNRATFLRETIDSVFSQNYPRLEYIVLDDGSTDDTLKVLGTYGDRIKVVSHPNMGETRTVNKGLAMASGEFITIVNSDDPIRPDAFAAIINAMLATPDALVGYPDWHETDLHGSVIRTLRLPQYDIDSMLLNFDVSMGPGAIFRRAALERTGLRKEALRYAADTDHWIRIALVGPFVHVPRVLATHRTHDDAASSTGKGWQLAWEVSRLGYDALADPAIPEHLLARRRYILARAHRAAKHFAGDDRAARAYHVLLYGWYRIIKNLEKRTKPDVR
jgi:glycosyltransferase involved in cell wall biosynthesis